MRAFIDKNAFAIRPKVRERFKDRTFCKRHVVLRVKLLKFEVVEGRARVRARLRDAKFAPRGFGTDGHAGHGTASRIALTPNAASVASPSANLPAFSFSSDMLVVQPLEAEREGEARRCTTAVLLFHDARTPDTMNSRPLKYKLPMRITSCGNGRDG